MQDRFKPRREDVQHKAGSAGGARVKDKAARERKNQVVQRNEIIQRWPRSNKRKNKELKKRLHNTVNKTKIIRSAKKRYGN